MALKLTLKKGCPLSISKVHLYGATHYTQPYFLLFYLLFSSILCTFVAEIIE